jgi:hypothetical protein
MIASILKSLSPPAPTPPAGGAPAAAKPPASGAKPANGTPAKGDSFKAASGPAAALWSLVQPRLDPAALLARTLTTPVTAGLHAPDSAAAGGNAGAASASGSTPGEAAAPATAVADFASAPTESSRVFDRKGVLQTDALRAFGQMDSDVWTVGDDSRCAANAAVAALAMRGKGALKTGVDDLRGKIKSDIGKSSDPQERADLRYSLKQLDRISTAVDKNTVTVKDLNRFADVLYQTHDTIDGDRQMEYPDIARMNARVGLISAWTDDKLDVKVAAPVGTITFSLIAPNRGMTTASVASTSKAFQQAQYEVTARLLDKIPNGQSASVGVFNPAAASPAGRTGVPNHIINVGKTKHGQLYVYDAGNAPHYRTGAEAFDHLRKHIGVSAENEQIAQDRRTSTYDAYPTAPFLLQQGAEIN